MARWLYSRDLRPRLMLLPANTEKAQKRNRTKLIIRDLMRVESKILMTAFLGAVFVSPAFAGEAGFVRSNYSYVVRSSPGTIARLQDAADKAQRDALDGNKNNLQFRRKNYEIKQVIARLEEGSART